MTVTHQQFIWRVILFCFVKVNLLRCAILKQCFQKSPVSDIKRSTYRNMSFVIVL